jgi:hypothetical protein
MLCVGRSFDVVFRGVVVLSIMFHAFFFLTLQSQLRCAFTNPRLVHRVGRDQGGRMQLLGTSRLPCLVRWLGGA